MSELKLHQWYCQQIDLEGEDISQYANETLTLTIFQAIEANAKGRLKRSKKIKVMGRYEQWRNVNAKTMELKKALQSESINSSDMPGKYKWHYQVEGFVKAKALAAKAREIWTQVCGEQLAPLGFDNIGKNIVSCRLDDFIVSLEYQKITYVDEYRINWGIHPIEVDLLRRLRDAEYSDEIHPVECLLDGQLQSFMQPEGPATSVITKDLTSLKRQMEGEIELFLELLNNVTLCFSDRNKFWELLSPDEINNGKAFELVGYRPFYFGGIYPMMMMAELAILHGQKALCLAYCKIGRNLLAQESYAQKEVFESVLAHLQRAAS